LVKLLTVEAFAAFPFLDTLNKASIQCTSSSTWLLEATRATIKGKLWPKNFQHSNASGGMHGGPNIGGACCTSERSCCNQCALTLPSLAPLQSVLCHLTKSDQTNQPTTMRAILIVFKKY